MAKRVLSILLAMALGLGLLVPAFAMEDELPGEAFAAQEQSYAPIITKQPSARANGSYSITLEVEACLPEGVTGELQYRWYFYKSMFSSYIVATQASAVIDIERTTIDNYCNLEDVVSHLLAEPVYYAEITNVYEDDEGNIVSARTRSEGIRVYAAMSLFDALGEYWTYGSEGGAKIAAGVFFMATTLPILLPAFLLSRVSIAFYSLMSLLERFIPRGAPPPPHIPSHTISYIETE